MFYCWRKFDNSWYDVWCMSICCWPLIDCNSVSVDFREVLLRCPLLILFVLFGVIVLRATRPSVQWLGDPMLALCSVWTNIISDFLLIMSQSLPSRAAALYSLCRPHAVTGLHISAGVSKKYLNSIQMPNLNINCACFLHSLLLLKKKPTWPPTHCNMNTPTDIYSTKQIQKQIVASWGKP